MLCADNFWITSESKTGLQKMMGELAEEIVSNGTETNRGISLVDRHVRKRNGRTNGHRRRRGILDDSRREEVRLVGREIQRRREVQGWDDKTIAKGNELVVQVRARVPQQAISFKKAEICVTASIVLTVSFAMGSQVAITSCSSGIIVASSDDTYSSNHVPCGSSSCNKKRASC